MTLKITQDIRSVTDFKRNTREILDQARQTRRPIVLTVDGKADAVLMDAESFECHVKASNLARLLQPAEAATAEGRTRSMRSFLKEFKDARKIPR